MYTKCIYELLYSSLNYEFTLHSTLENIEFLFIHTVSENIIATTKIRNNYGAIK